jgi:O-antigen/teichoic acid export membrane protein
MVEGEKRWWERRELEIQVVALAISLLLIILGVLLPSPIMAGAGFLGAIFSLTYIAYAYVRRFQ